MPLKRGQVWVETVLYTIIGLAIIGLVLAFITPKIQESKEKAIIDSTIEGMKLIDQKIEDITRTPGNVRVIEILVQLGQFEILSGEDRIAFTFYELDNAYSEPGEQFNIGAIELLTERTGKNYNLTLVMEYGQDIRFNGEDSEEVLPASSQPYTLRVSNEGKNSENRTVINIAEEIR